MSWPTIRRHPRTLWEAYPDVRASWSEGWMRTHHHRWAGRLLAVAIGVVLGLLLVVELAK